MTAPLLRLVPGQPFVYGGCIYYKEFQIMTPRGHPFIRCFRVNRGIVDFKKVNYFEPDTIVEIYEKSNNKT